MYRSPRGSFGKEADAVSAVTAYAAQAAHFILPVIALIVLIRCVVSMFYGRAEPETWGHLVTPDGKVYPLLHWECLIGRARSADITLPYPDVANVHAVLMRNDAGEWTVSDLSRSGGVYLNGEQITEPTQVFSGDILRCSTHMLKFADMSEERRAVQEQRRTIAGRKVSAGGTLFFLTVFQLLLALEFVSSADSAHLLGILMSFAALALTQWFCYVLMRTMDRSGFEVETIAFFLCTLGLEICATSTPDDLTKEIILIIVGIALFFLLGWWLRDLSHVKALRWPAAIISLALLALNLFAAREVFGAKNWLTIAGFSLQPSELIKVAFIYVGATSLNRMFRSKSILLFIAFSAICVGGLALMGDFGSALIFFATFLVIAFMRSGSIATVLLAVTSAAEERNLRLYPVSGFASVSGLGVSGNVDLENESIPLLLGNKRLMEERQVAFDAVKDLDARLAGLSDSGATPLLLAVSGRLVGMLAVADAIRPETAGVGKELRPLGLRGIMLSGDNRRTAEAIAKAAGIDEVIADVLPDGKEKVISELQASGLRVGMIGDGINDAPALARADVGMAMGNGIDVAVEAGDIVLLGSDTRSGKGLRGVVTALELSRAALRNIRENLGWAFGYNILCLPIAAGVLKIFGGPSLSPMIAGTAMAFSSVSVVLNALRLRRFGK